MSTKNSLQHIKETAYQMFAQYGIDKTSFAMIAKNIGISKPALYYYFESKDALVETIFEELYLAITNSFTLTIPPQKEDFLVSTIQFGEKLIQDQLQDPYFTPVFNEYLLLSTRKDCYTKRMLAMQEHIIQYFIDLLQYGVEIGIIGHEKIVEKATILALVLDNISNYILTGFPLNYKEIWSLTVHQVLEAS